MGRSQCKTQDKSKHGLDQILPTPGDAKAKAMPGRLYIHTKIIINKILES